VVVHVVFNNAVENISDEQIVSQIDVLNRDFRMRNTDLGLVPLVFQPLIADAQVQFELATTDPAGNPTSGITRTQTTAISFSDDDRVKSAATGGADPWAADRYLNVWICALNGAGLLGYAQFPGGAAATDGVVITYTAFGTTGTATAPFNLGRTATHEIGHWLNLRHIWGDDGTGCNGSDFVDDTPNQGGSNIGTPAFPHVSCNNGPNGDLFMNYMDYVDDAAMFMFTAGQVTRMLTALDNERSSVGHRTYRQVTPAAMVLTGELHLLAVDGNDGLWHTIRAADGGWPFGWGDVRGTIVGLGRPDVASLETVSAAVGRNGELHLLVLGRDGSLWHTIRTADGGWPFGWGDVDSVVP